MNFSRRSGLTLIEVLVSIGLISVLIGAVTFVSLMVFRAWPVESAHTDQRLEASNVLETMLKDLRSAFEISSAEANQITFWQDRNDNGRKDIPDEERSFFWSGTVGEGLYRRNQDLSLNQQILSNINNFSISYFDADNQILAVPVTDLALIRALNVVFESQIDDEVINLRFNVKVRNL